jgi:hypothetical protein
MRLIEHRLALGLVAIAVSISATANTFAAEPVDRAERSRTRAFWGTVIKASDESLTVTPEVGASRRGNPPPKPEDRTFALAKDKTEFAYAEVGMARMMFDGTMMRTLNEPEPAAAADLKPGQLVQVTPGEDAAAPAKRVFITWSVPATIVKVDGESITIRPVADTKSNSARRDDGGEAEKAPAVDAEDRTLEIGKSTRVRIASVTDDRPAPGAAGANGRRITSISYRDGELAELKPGQSVVVCIKNETAAKITIMEGPTAAQSKQ